MKIKHKDLKKGEIKVTVENHNDLWYLSSVIENGDYISGKTVRKIRIGEGTDRNSKVTKKVLFLSIQVDKVDYSPELLRLGGSVLLGPEEVPKGSHHTFNVEEGITIMITKPKWLKFQVDKLEEATKEQGAPILLCVFDREEAWFAKLVKGGYEVLSNLKGNVTKKADESIKGENFYARIIAQVKEYVTRLESTQILMASPSFWKDELLKELKDAELRKKMTLATVSSVGKTSFNELLKRDEVKAALKEERFAKELNIVESLMKEVSKGDLAAYGKDEVRQAIEAGAVSMLLVTENFINTAREKNTYNAIERMLKKVESMQGDVFIVASEHEGGQMLDGIGGIGAILRYRIN